VIVIIIMITFACSNFLRLITQAETRAVTITITISITFTIRFNDKLTITELIRLS